MTHIKDYTGRRAHLIGIGGSSMSGLAGMLVKLGVRVTGSDSARSYTTDALEQSGIHVFIGQRAENVDGADIVIYSAAIAKSNPERVRAEELGIPQMERATLLGQPGKLVKVSGGSMQTHSQYGDGRRETLIAHLALMGAPVELLEFVRQSVTLDGCISPIYDAGFDAVWTHLADAAAAYAAARIHGEMRVDAVMLSDETAMGDFPVESVETMARIAREIERDETHFKPMIDMDMVSVNHEITAQLARSAVRASTNLPIKYVVLDTKTGRTGRYLAAFRGQKTVMAVCYQLHAQRILALSYGVVPILRNQELKDRYHFLIDALEVIEQHQKLDGQDLLAIVGGSFGPDGGASYVEIANVLNIRRRNEEIVAAQKS